ncbi:hypothetical protein GCK32_015687 [Trichostrongylus colubriformis]|uniref:Uncharacterized protein n=1 Tax=Trichostrongylus colubriformis TaxID=6319 RepID=A0AAN8FK21_TRICO
MTAVSHDYSAYSLPASETFVDMDDIEPNSVKTAEMEVLTHTPPPSETDVDMEQDVVGGASPMSTAVTGSISWYSMPPSETNVEMPSSMHEDHVKVAEIVEDISDQVNESILRCQDYLENLALNESVGSELDKAFLEAEETDTDESKDPYDFDTAIEA